MSTQVLSVLRRMERARTLAPAAQLPQGLDAGYQILQGYWMRWFSPADPLRQSAERVLQKCQALDSLSDDAMQTALLDARCKLRCDPQDAQGDLEQVLATVGQLALRSLGLRPHAVQYMGALALHGGFLAEMATGEGKTLTVGMAATLAGLTGRPCHVITANDYLAGRDAEEMQALFRRCGLHVTSVVADTEPEVRPACYDADIVYLTAKDLLADYLRDQIGEGSEERQAQHRFAQWMNPDADLPNARPLLVRGLHTAIVDEADSMLIDEAVTPLILAAPIESRGLAESVRVVSELANTLVAWEDYSPQVQGQRISLLPSAVARLANLAPTLPELWRPAPRREELLRQALSVRCFYKPGQHYVVQDDEVVLLDEFTGRMTPGRSLTGGMHQAIEACEGVTITDPNQSLTQMSFQTFFRRFRKLSGCSGTVWEAAIELWRVYGLQVIRVPTHRPRLTRYNPPVVLQDADQKWQGVAQEVLRVHQQGRPVLVGIRSVASSEVLCGLLAGMGCEAQVLNALKHADEAQIVAEAGRMGAVTIATHMAGRGTDIRLSAEVLAQGGLHVILAEANDSGRIDRQLAGRCGRQGDPGSVSTYWCLADDLVGRMMPLSLRWLLQQALERKPQWAARLAPWIFKFTQQRAEKVAFQRRWSVLRSDDWMQSALPFVSRGLGSGQ